jgi:predicted phosphodiesterase
MYKNFNLLVILITTLVTGFIFYFIFNKSNISSFFINESEFKNTALLTNDYENEIDNSFIDNSHKISTRIFVIADSHLSENSFFQIKKLVNQYSPNLIIHLGDHTDYGDLTSLAKAKEYLDSLNKNYVVLPGDRDLGQTGDTSNFFQIFTQTNQLYIDGMELLFLNNSYNISSLENLYFNNILIGIKSADILFTSQPIYVEQNNIFYNKYMGSLENNFDSIYLENLKKYNSQRNELLDVIRKKQKLIVVSGDHHRSSEFIDPINQNIKYYIVGGTSEKIYFGDIEINQKSLQQKSIGMLEKTSEGIILYKNLILE